MKELLSLVSPTMLLGMLTVAFFLGVAVGALASPWRRFESQHVTDAWWEGYTCRKNEEQANLIRTQPHGQHQDPRKN